MVTFRRLIDQIYLEPAYHAAPGKARVAFIARTPIPEDEIDPISKIGQGCFVVYPELADWDAFAKRAQQMLNDANREKDARVALLSRAGAILRDQLVRAVQLNALVRNTVLSIGQSGSNAGGGVYTPPTGNERWAIALYNCVLTAEADRRGLRIKFQDMADEPGLMLDSNILVPPPSGAQYVRLPITGDDRGLWNIPAMLDARMLDMLGVGPTYFKAQTSTQINRVTYPLFDFASGMRERFDFHFDLSDPYNKLGGGTRSRLQLPSTKLPVHLHAVHGQRLFLKAAPGASLALLRSPERLISGANPPVLRKLEHHFAPEGDFELHVDERGVDVLRLGLGASNLESVAVRVGASGDLLRFVARESLIIDDKGAALAGMASGGDLPRSPLDSLGGLCETSWLQIVNSRRAQRTTQLALDAEGMQAYAPLGGGMMQFDPSRSALASEPMPWVPVLGMSQAAGFDIERRYLSRVRRQQALPKPLIAPIPLSLAGPQDELRTPQGYWASRAAERGAFAKITFGRTSPYQPASALSDELPDFGLRPINGTSQNAEMLADLLAHNRLFVVTALSKLVKYFEPALLKRIYMADWRVGGSQDNLDNPSVRDPWVILKHDNRPISALIEDAGQWSNQTGGLALTIDERRRVRERVATILENAKTNPLYQPTRDRLTNPDWSGLLLLNLDMSAMPPQLGALEALLDKPLEVNHVGIDLNAIRPGARDRSKTAVFGLVDFDDPDAAFLPKGNAAFQLRLTKLKLLVDNDAVEDFTCQIQASIREFLQTPVEAQPKPLTLLGRYESRVTEDGERRESYNFSVETEKVFTFDKDSFLKSFAIRRIALVSEGKKQGKLLVDGSVAFNKIGGDFDLLGIEQLDFAELGIRFQRIGEFYLAIDFPNIRFDFGAFNRRSSENKPRPGSFLSKLPIKLRGFRFGGFKLPELGYFDFSGLSNIKLISDFKMAFDFDVDLGSLGSLAKKFERFKLNILIGWTPGNFDSEVPLAFGFRIDAGEGGGALDFGIQGIMQLTAEHFRLSSAKSGGQDVIILAASDARLRLFSIEVPSSKSTRFDFYLFGPIKGGFPGAEKLGWYTRLEDSAADSQIAVRNLAIGQRIEMRLGDDGEPKTVRDTLQWLKEQQEEFKTDKDFIDFAGKPDSPLNYAPEREWFVAMAGSFFKIAEIQLLLRDPDLYGVYFKLLGQDLLSIDLIYQKLADGVGRYAAEIMLPADLRNFDFGAVALTLGLIRVELYTDGGFLIDLGFPEHVDYTRSFVVQGGPFIGKGGFYIGCVPREAMPAIPKYPTGQAFRVGFALRIGLGREVEKGPLRASLSVSVFGRFEGLIARKKQVTPPPRELDASASPSAALADAGYYVWLQGEVGIILEIEGRVDLKLIQARALARAWLAVGVTLESGEPILLHGEVGIEISLEVVIGEVRIFRRTIRITVNVGYSTRLRYEWTLPARFPETLALNQAMPLGWALPAPPAAPQPFTLKLLVDISRSIDGGAAKAVLIPTAFVIEDTADFEVRNPYRTLGRALIHWAVELCGKDPATVTLRRTEPLPSDSATDLFVGLVQEKLRDFDALPMATLDQFLAGLFAGSTIDIAFGTPPAPPQPKDEPAPSNAKAYAFPLPPGLKLALGAVEYDFAKIGLISDIEVAAISDALARQFAQQQAARSATSALAAAAARPMVEHLFRGWCELFALTTLETLMADWSPSEPSATLSQLFATFNWRIAASRTGRTALGGIRIASGSGTLPLYSRAGLLLDVPQGDELLRIAGVSGASWLAAGDGEMAVVGANAALMALADPQITSTIVQPPARKTVHRSFLQPPFDKLRMLDTAQTIGLLNPLSGDFVGRLLLTKSGLLPPIEYRARRMNTKSGEKVDEGEQPLKAPVRALRFEMMVDTVERSRDVDAPAGEPVRDCLQISGASEAERRPLDALLSRLGGGDPEARLNGATIYLGVRDAAGGIDLIEALQPGLQLARSTVSIERRPAPVFAKTATPIDEDTVFLADAQDLVRFLGLLQRAAIVNSGGTYLLLPRNSALFEKLTQTAGAKLCVLILFAPASPLPPGAVNSVLLKGTDAQTLDQSDDGQPRRLVGRAVPIADPLELAKQALELPELFETVLVREPGSALLRVWRDRPNRDRPRTIRRSDPPSPEECAAHLASLLDMLEFGVERDGKSLIDIDRSLPLASEEAIPKEATAEQIADLVATLPPGSDAGDLLRYDLLVPIWRFADAKDPENPYAAIDGKSYRVTLGWRDIYGNRLGKISDEAYVELRYQDPIVPVSAWPGVRAWFSAGDRPKTLRLVLAALDETGTALDTRQDRTRRLLQVIHQLEGPGVTLTVRSGLGAVTAPAKLIVRIAEWLRKVQSGASPAALEIELPVKIDEASAHRRLDLELTMERATALCDRDASADVSTAVSPFALRRRKAGVKDPADGREAVLIATDMKSAFTGHWAALGTDDAGGNSWWLIDQRLFPKAAGDPLMYAQPPLARAPMSVAEVAYPDLFDDGSLAEPPPRRSGHDLDSDALMATFLERVEAFLAPPLAATIARLPGAGGKDAPFVRVMRAKHAMLSSGSATELLRHVGPVFVKDANAGNEAKLAAIRVLRDACAAKLTRFHEVISVVVQPLTYVAKTPTSWFAAAAGDDQLAPKLYGRMRFGTQDAGAQTLSAIRSLSHGIPLSAGSTALAFALLPPANQAGGPSDEIKLTERVSFEITHVEREVDAGMAALDPSSVAAPPAPSRWLSIVPIDAVASLPTINVRRGKQLTAPAPLRRLPRPPGIAAPQITALPGALPADYAAAIKQVRSWIYGLELTGLEANDQACCRFVYNAGVGPETLPVTQTPAAPLFDALLPKLVAFEAAMAAQPGTPERPGLWHRITVALGGGSDPQLPKACALFADLVEAVVAALGEPKALGAGPPALEDRFIVSFRSSRANQTEVSIAFVDHLAQDEKPLPPNAGAGVPMIEVAFPGASAQSGTIDPKTLRKSFTFAQAMPIPSALSVHIGTMDTITLQSIWPAASVRRNSTLAGLPANPNFIYRTSEIYLQEPRVPRLKEMRSIKLTTPARASLVERLTNALRPILMGAQGTIPVQLRLGVESVRLSKVTANAGGASAFLPEPDPKVQLIVEISEADVPETAQRLVNSLTQMVQGEPLGATADVQLILSVVVRTDNHQPMLEISRIIIPMN